MITIVKKSLLFLIAVVLFQGLTAVAQDEDKTKVHLKVKKNDKVTLDTTLYIKSGAESDELKELLQKYTDNEDMNLYFLGSDDLHKHHAFKVMEKGTDSLKTIIVTAGDKSDNVDIEIHEKDGQQVLIRKKISSEEGEKTVAYVYTNADNTKMVKDFKIKIDTLESLDEKDEKGNYYIVKKVSDLEEGEEIVIKKKEGNVIIMKGDEIHDLKGKDVYIKTYDNKEGSFDIFLEKGDDGTVVVKKNMKVIRKKDEEGEVVIEVIIEEGDKVKIKEGTKEKKADKEKKSKEIK